MVEVDFEKSEENGQRDSSQTGEHSTKCVCLVTFFDKIFVPFGNFDDEIFFAIGYALASQP